MAARGTGARHAARDRDGCQLRLEELCEAITRAYFSHVPMAQAVGSMASLAASRCSTCSRIARPTPTPAASTAAHHIAHLRARPFPGQKVTSISIDDAVPRRRWRCSIVDHFGNLIDIYRIDQPHTALRHRGARRGRGEVSRSAAGRHDAAVGGGPQAALSGDGFPDADRGERIRLRIAAGARVDGVERLRCQVVHAGPADPRSGARAHRRIKADFEYHPAPPTSRRPCTRCSRARPASARISPMSMIAALRAHGLAAALRLGLHPHRPFQGGDRAARRRCEPRLGRGVVRRGGGLGAARPDQRPRGQGRPCRRRLGPRLLRREPAARRHPGRRVRTPTAWR